MSNTTTTGPQRAEMTAIYAAGERLLLHPERAVLWPDRSTLLLADTHFGKDAEFRRQGIAIPDGGARRDLLRLGRLVTAYRPQRVVVLGDFFHTAPAAEEPFLSAFRDWYQRHVSLRIDIIRGNHDPRNGAVVVPGTTWHDRELTVGPLILRHEPQPDPRGIVLAGHVHPVVQLNGRGGDRARLPAFWETADVLTLPAFGGFTGGYRVEPSAANRLYAVCGQRVAAIGAPTTN